MSNSDENPHTGCVGALVLLSQTAVATVGWTVGDGFVLEVLIPDVFWGLKTRLQGTTLKNLQ